MKNEKIKVQKNQTLRFGYFCLVPMAGLEPARSFPRGILSPLRLPFRHIGILEAPPRIELGMKVLQTSALPLGYGATNLPNIKIGKHL